MAKSKSDKDVDKMVKQGVEFGVGLALIAVKSLNGALDKLEKEGKIDSKASERLVSEAVKRYEAEGEKYAKSVQSQMDRLAKSTFPYISKKQMKEINKEMARISKTLSQHSK